MILNKDTAEGKLPPQVIVESVSCVKAGDPGYGPRFLPSKYFSPVTTGPRGVVYLSQLKPTLTEPL